MDDIIKSRVQPSTCPSKILVPTICLFVTYLVFGEVTNIIGPTLVHLGYVFNENIAKMSLVFTFMSIGYGIGSFLTGIIFDRFNPLIQFFLISLLMGIICIVSPWVPNVYWFYIVITVLYVTVGYFESSALPYPVQLWSGYNVKGPITQAFYAIAGIGNFIGPFVVWPFLVELSNTNDIIVNTSLTCSNLSEVTTYINAMVQEKEIDGIEQVRYPYAIIGSVMCLTSIGFICAYVITAKPKANNLKQNDNNKDPNQQLSDTVYERLQFKVLYLSILTLFSFFLFYGMMIPSALLSTFVIKGLKWNVEKGPLVTSIFSGSQAAGRLLAIPASALIQPAMMLSLNVTITTAAFILLSFVSSSTPYLVWISAVLAGLGTSTTFPTLFLWTANFFPMSGSVGAVFFIAGSFGVMTGTALAGYMFEHYSHMWVAYICLLAAVADVGLLVLALIFVQYHKMKNKTVESKNDISIISHTKM